MKSGDTLSQLALTNCGKADDWTGTWYANRRLISNPNLIYPGWHVTMVCTVKTVDLPAAPVLTAAHTGGSTLPTSDDPPPPIGQPADPAPYQPPAATGGISAAYDAFPGASCIVTRESGGNAVAQNPDSTASGLFQDLDSTWNGYDGYPRAMDAPVSVQIAFNQQLAATAGLSPWASDGCPGT